MARRVYAKGKQFDNVHELRESILKVWGTIESPLLATLIGSMTNRIFTVTKNNGGSLDY